MTQWLLTFSAPAEDPGLVQDAGLLNDSGELSACINCMWWWVS